MSQLKRARKEGRLAEALLDRRAKLKRRVCSDSFRISLSSDFTTVIDSVENFLALSMVLVLCVL
jgi:hypothetical protein